MSNYRTYTIVSGIAVILLFLLPQMLPEIYVHLVTEILVYALFAVSFNLLFGYSGLLPFGHAALFGVGAYVAALIFKYYPNVPLLLTFVVATFSGVVPGLIIGFFCVRLKGAYFALITLAFQMFLFAVALRWRSITYGDDGMGVTRPDLHLPVLGIVSMRDIQNVYYLTLIIVGIGILACYLFLKTPLGNSVVCVREKDSRAAYLGYSVFLTRYAVYLFSGFWASLAGSLFVFFHEFVATSSIDINMSMTCVFMAIIGGTGYFLGPVLGAAFYLVFQDWISSLTKHWWIVMGICFVLIVMYLKGGLVSLFRMEKIRVLTSRLRK
jgi:branched-chain amino acid transport system permease protein